MFRPLRRVRQELSLGECSRILEQGSSGVLAVCSEDGYPYAVPLSYVYLSGNTTPAPDEGRLGSLVFHCSRKGLKVDILRGNPRASFCVIDRDEPIPVEFSTYYASVIAFGTVRFVGDDEEKRRLLAALAAKYSPGLDAEAREEIERLLDATCVIELRIEHLNGKQAKALVASKPS